MRRLTGTVVLLASALAGCVSVDQGPQMSGPVCEGHNGKSGGPPSVPGLQGPWGQSVPMAAPYNSMGPVPPWAAPQMMANSVPLDMMQMSGRPGPSGLQLANAQLPGSVTPPGGMISPPGVPFGPNPTVLPSGPGGPGMPPGGMQPPPGMTPPPGQIAAVGGQLRFPTARTQVRFAKPSGMRITWLTQGPDAKPAYAATPIETPGRYNFLQAAIYRLKLSNIEGRPGLELYPTLEVVPCNHRTEAFLSHSPVPIEFTPEDFDQVAAGNYIVKVIYLPNPEFQDQAATGIEEIISTRLEPGADPIKEALRRGSILLVIRMGAIDQEAPNTPPLTAPPQSAPPQPGVPPGLGLGPIGPMGPTGPTGPFAPPMPPSTGLGSVNPMAPNPFVGPGSPTATPLPPFAK